MSKVLRSAFKIVRFDDAGMETLAAAQPDNEPVDVLFYYDGRERYARPVRLVWDGYEYELGEVEFWSCAQVGGRTVHRYTVSDRQGCYSFRLALETEKLTWQLEHAIAADEQPAGYPALRLAGAAA